MKFSISICLILASLLWSCQKKEATAADPAKVSISITSPVPADIYRSGDSVYINATVTYPSELHGYEIKITDTLSGYILYDNAQHVHADRFDISQVWATSGSATQALKLELIADIDHNGAVANSVLYFSYTP